jgi:branched-chain amino acid transport system substrate-binding protein
MTDIRSKRWRLLAAAAILLSLVGAACSSDSDGSSAAKSTTTAADSSDSSTVKGDPVKVYELDNGSTGDPTDAVKAIESGVNARGGIAGRPLEIIRCNDKGDPNQASQCVQKAADDGAIALIGASPFCGSQEAAILEKEGMASVGDQYFCPDILKAKNAFPFNAGSFTAAAGAAAGVKLFKQPNILVSTIDISAGRQYPLLLNAVTKPLGGKVTAEVYIPFSATDLAPFAAQLVGKKGVLSEGDTVDIGARLVKELEQQGFDQPILFNHTTWDADEVKQNLGNPTNAYITTGYDLESEGYKMFEADMAKYAPNASRAGHNITRWLAANILADIAKDLPEVTRAAVLDHFSTATSINTFGLTPSPLTFTVENKGLGGFMPRVSNDKVALYKYDAGKWVRKTDFEALIP